MIGPRSSAARHGAEGASTPPHPLARAVVDLAVALSPADHRPVRMEQWHADLRDAADLDLPRASLAFGALTTALFHRRAVHRSTWGESMSALSGRAAPRTIRTSSALVAFAICSMLVGAGLSAMGSRYDGSDWIRVLTVVVVALLVVVPALAAIGALLLTDASTRGRRLAGVGFVVLGAAGLAALVLTSTPGPAWAWLGGSAVAVAAGRLVLRSRSATDWWLLGMPVIATALGWPLTEVWSLATVVPYTALFLVMLLAYVVPFLGSIAAAVLAGRLDDARATGGGLVDKDV
ncbi:hypothetical protein [Curtobacterium sp. MCBD17_013]|uniref:hypothetical protein n=1 Tax=Curtobacterium sp. MCBD17_013 TaxID=2175668 RepID=UPI0011B46566|nr:hypothetical protein [Curtobacterium sp. MCBD17_013]